MVRTGLLDGVRLLLTKAERADTVCEADTYNAAVREMIARHGIDRALLADAGRIVDPIESAQFPIQEPYSAAKARLAGWTASALGLRWTLRVRTGGSVASVTVFGYRSDIQRAEALITSLLVQAADRVNWVSGDATAGQPVSGYRCSWLYGFAVTAYAQVRAAEKQALTTAEANTAGAAVEPVLIRRQRRVEDAFCRAYPNLCRASAPAVSGGWLGAGAQAGRRVDSGTRVEQDDGPWIGP